MGDGELVIRNEEDAWRILQQALSGELGNAKWSLAFDGWPSYKIRIEGRDWHQSVPTRIMPALLAMQRNIYKTYADLRYFDGNVARLTEEERELLELVVTVGNGSSLFGIKFDEILNEIAKRVADKMTGAQLIQIVVAVAFITGTTYLGSSWIAAQTEQKRIAADAAKTAEEADLKLALSQEETKRLQLVGKVAASSQPVADSWAREEEVTREVLKRVKPQDRVEIGSFRLTGSEANEIAKAARAAATSLEISGNFRVLRVDASGNADFKVRVMSVPDGEEFNIFVPLGLAIEQQRLIQQAEWTRTVIHLDILAERYRGLIRNASVTSARPPVKEIPQQ